MLRSTNRRLTLGAIASVVLCVAISHGWATSGKEVQARVAADIAAGRPLVAHVVVALCDNEHQGIVPVPAQLGNGQDPKSNLYWGALYGLRTHLTRSAGWERLAILQPPHANVLERAVFRTTVRRESVQVPIYLVADAWDGAQIKGAIERSLAHSAGHNPETIQLKDGQAAVDLSAGGAAHLVGYVGHNGLMEFSVPSPRPESTNDAPRSSLVLACASKDYFADHLGRAGSHALLLTTGLMAPEAYTLDAAIRAWVSDGSTASVVEAAAVAYDRYQECGLAGARRLFWGSP